MGLGIILHTFERLLGMVIPAMMLPFTTIDPNIVELPPFFHFMEFLSKILSVTLGYNANIFLNWGPPNHMSPAHLASLVGIEGRAILPTSEWRAVAVLAGYIILFLGWALRIIQQRDVTYGS